VEKEGFPYSWCGFHSVERGLMKPLMNKKLHDLIAINWHFLLNYGPAKGYILPIWKTLLGALNR
jgi:hypothetical protein